MSIATELTRIIQAKSDISDAIEAKGVDMTGADTLDDYPAKIAEISGGGGSITFGDLKTCTFVHPAPYTEGTLGTPITLALETGSKPASVTYSYTVQSSDLVGMTGDSLASFYQALWSLLGFQNLTGITADINYWLDVVRDGVTTELITGNSGNITNNFYTALQFFNPTRYSAQAGDVLNFYLDASSNAGSGIRLNVYGFVFMPSCIRPINDGSSIVGDVGYVFTSISNLALFSESEYSGFALPCDSYGAATAYGTSSNTVSGTVEGIPAMMEHSDYGVLSYYQEDLVTNVPTSSITSGYRSRRPQLLTSFSWKELV